MSSSDNHHHHHGFMHDTPNNAPVFFPNEEEFSDALDYIAKIKPIAERAGICKIIPPKSWQPNFYLDSQKFKFTPRIQKINELEAGTRIKINFLENLAKFWELQGTKLKIPNLEKKSLDLYRLHKTVGEQGGYEEIVKNKKWSLVAKLMDLKDSGSPRILKYHYEKLIYPFDVFKSGITINNEDESLKEKKTKPTELSIEESDEMQKYSNIKKRKLNIKHIENISCYVCNRGDDEAFILLCDDCDASYHTYCLYPPLPEIPKGDWRCPKCVAKICKESSDLYGFEQSAKEYTLAEFGEMADRFKQDYFDKPPHSVPYDVVEKEFWKILSTPNDLLSVKYGADLHTLDVGSGFQFNKDDISNTQYTKSDWNLNNLPQLKKSVLSILNADISGMKIPWAYVGMCFSCFCWHVEDHWSYSINYLHFGEPKTWYGVPGAFAEKFEDVMKENAPELFEKSPDLLHHLVTIMNPAILLKHGVPISKTYQKAGEFIVTFPRAYHAGFNQGFNFAEAVNFCPSDWLQTGRAAIEHYKQLKRYPVFSHDELVCKIASNDDMVENTAQMVHEELLLLIDYERKNRKILQGMGLNEAKNVLFELLPDDERQCIYCKTTCFTSAASCSCKPTNLVCINHVQYLCKCDISNYTLKYRYTLDELWSMLSKTKQISEKYNKWINEVKNMFSNKTKKYKLEEFKEKIDCAIENGYDKNNDLYEKLVEVVENGESCETIIKSLYNSFQDNNTQSIEMKVQFNLVQFKNFMNKSTEFYFPELNYLSAKLLEIIEFEKNVNECLQNKVLDCSILKKYLDYCSKVKIDMEPLYSNLQSHYDQALWISEVSNAISTNNMLNLNTIQSLLVKASTFTSENSIITKKFINLQELYCIAKLWDNKAKTYLENNTVYNLDELENISNEGKFVPVHIPNMDKLINMVNNAKKWNDKAIELTDNTKHIALTKLEELIKESKKIDVKLKKLDELKDKLGKYLGWKNFLEGAYLKQKSTYTILDLLVPNFNEIIKSSKSNKNVLNNETEIDINSLLEAYLKYCEPKEIEKIKKIRQNNHQNFHNTVSNGDDKLNLKCYECSKHLSTNHFNICNLCFNIVHVECSKYLNNSIKFLNEQSNPLLCSKCEKSKRPNFQYLQELLSKIEELKINSHEKIALNLLVKRVFLWNKNCIDILKSPELKGLMLKFESVENQKYEKINFEEKEIDEINSYIINAFKSLTESLKLQLEEIYLNGIHLECDSFCIEDNSKKVIYIMNLIDKEKFNQKIHEISKIKTNMKMNSNKRLRNIETNKLPTSPNELKILKIGADKEQKQKKKSKNEDICAASLCHLPIGDNIEWVQCDGPCNRWFHLICVGVSKIGANDDYICAKCKD